MTNTLSGGETPLPKNLLYQPASQALVAKREEAFQAVAELVRPDLRAEFLSKAPNVLPRIGAFFAEEHFPFRLGEIEEIKLDFLSIHDEAFMRVDGVLIADRSPFVFDNDLERFPDAMHYTILTTPELPPLLALTEELDDNSSSGTLSGDVRHYLNLLGEEGRKPRFLPEDAQTNLIAAIRAAKVDPTKCADEISKIPAVHDLLA